MILLILLLFLLFIIWSSLMKLNLLVKIDDFVYEKINFSNFKTLFYKIITSFACTPFLFICCSLIFLFMNNKREALAIVIFMLIDAFIVFLVKHIVRRDRPNIKRLVKEKGYSYPSGHTFSATCFYGFLLIWLFNSGFNFKIVGIVLFLLFVFLIAKSRIYLGVHYFSDVVAGFLLALSYLLLYVYFVYDILNLI